jgi:2-methylcitrate dehydratase PrpD
MDAIARLSDHVVRTSAGDLPPAAVAAAKTFILDAIGVGVAGSVGPWVDGLLDSLRAWGAAPDARVWVHGVRLPAPAVALANAYQIHNSEFDCVHEPSVVHAMTAVLPAVLAQAERQGGARGAELLVAATLGVDVACSVGVASRAPMRFFRPGTAGGFGATAAVGKLMGFDAATLCRAMGIVYSQLCGTMQAHAEGSILLGLQVGFNARNAVMACDMAARGAPGLEAVLEGPYGYYRLFEGAHDLEAALAGLGRTWRIAEMSHKPFPSGRATHGIVDGLLELRRRHGLAPERIERVVAAVPPLVQRLVGRPLGAAPAPGAARLCAGYVGARALIRGTVDPDDFRPAALSDAGTRALARRFEVRADDNPDPNALGPVAVEVTVTGGKRHAIVVEQVVGVVRSPLHLRMRHSVCHGAARARRGCGRESLAMRGDAPRAPSESAEGHRRWIDRTWITSVLGRRGPCAPCSPRMVLPTRRPPRGAWRASPSPRARPSWSCRW